ncbi:MAG: hypothetical protein HY960_13375 [Ignavibacteriae bacterium]|nr:hypothetical protein [Ignavibacteriota bacterium]
MKYLRLFIVLIFYFEYSTAQNTTDGIVWQEPILLSNGMQNAYSPKIALTGEDTLHVTWGHGFFNIRLPYCRSITGGKDFEPMRDLITDTLDFPFQAHRSHILTKNDTVIIIFAGATGSYAPLRKTISYDGGISWSYPRRITTDVTGEVTDAKINGNTIAVLYPPKDQYRKFLFSTNSGSSWTRRNEDFDDFNRIAVTEGIIHMVAHTWIPPTNETVYKQSTDYGISWNQETVVSEIDDWYSDMPTIAAKKTDCGTQMLTAWRDTKYGWFGAIGASIIARSGISNGRIWLPEKLLTPEPRYFSPVASMSTNASAVVMISEVSPLDTFHAAITATNSSLTNFTPVKDLTPNVRTVWVADVAVTAKSIHVVYEQKTGEFFSIYYRRGDFLQKDVQFNLSTGTVMFDTTETTTSSFDTIMVSNSGSDTLIVGTTISDDSNFSITPYDTTVSPGSSTQFVLSFTPVSDSLKSGKIIFYHNGESSPECITVSGVGKYRQEQQQYQSGWNLVSLPVRPGINHRLPSLYSFERGYEAETTMTFGKGYWAKPDSVVSFTGSYATDETVAVKEGWNILGSLSAPVQTNTLTSSPLNILASPFYGYGEEGYFEADAILPGKGYWVKVNQDGKIILQVQDTSRESAIGIIKSKIERKEDKQLAPTKAEIERYRTAEMMWYEGLLSEHESVLMSDKMKQDKTNYKVINKKLYQTKNKGTSWIPVNEFPEDVSFVAVNNSSPQTILVAVEHSIYRKSGSLWQPVLYRSRNFTPKEITFSTRNNDIVWMKASVTESGITLTEVWYSFNTGMTWELAHTSRTPSEAIHLQPDVYPPYWDECDTTYLWSEL